MVIKAWNWLCFLGAVLWCLLMLPLMVWAGFWQLINLFSAEFVTGSFMGTVIDFALIIFALFMSFLVIKFGLTLIQTTWRRATNKGLKVDRLSTLRQNRSSNVLR